ncbi:hypothetical protein BHS30_27055 [Klebsiella pneumoniae]|nr:hypothetical protein BHS30_27055 [Klebsiella pneumoniae]
MLARDAFFARQGHSIQQDGLPGDIRKYKVLCSATIIEMKLIEWLRARVGFPAVDAASSPAAAPRAT